MRNIQNLVYEIASLKKTLKYLWSHEQFCSHKYIQEIKTIEILSITWTILQKFWSLEKWDIWSLLFQPRDHFRNEQIHLWQIIRLCQINFDFIIFWAQLQLLSAVVNKLIPLTCKDGLVEFHEFLTIFFQSNLLSCRGYVNDFIQFKSRIQRIFALNGGVLFSVF